MSRMLRASLLVVCLSLCAQAQDRELQVNIRPASQIDGQTRVQMQIELQRLLEPAGLRVVWKTPSETTAFEAFDFVAAGSFDGDCSSKDLPAIGTKAASGVLSLAGTFTSNHQVIPFFNVDCARVIRMLRPTLARLTPESRETVVGQALGRVLAHEIYHIVAKTAIHAKTGVAKAEFSATDLTDSAFEFSHDSLEFLYPSGPKAAQLHHGPSSESLQ